VEAALAALVDNGGQISAEAVEETLLSAAVLESPREIIVADVDLSTYDALLEEVGV
jgi:hypothetical protein